MSSTSQIIERIHMVALDIVSVYQISLFVRLVWMHAHKRSQWYIPESQYVMC